jgi:hypothetical protein
VPADGFVGDSETALFVGLVQAHVEPGSVLLVSCLVGVSGALLQEGVGDLEIEVLLLVRELYMPVQKLQRGSLAKAYELVVDEAILDVVELVNVLQSPDDTYPLQSAG